MNRPACTRLSLAALVLPVIAAAQEQPTGNVAPCQSWPYSGVLTILTTPDGANLPASASLVRDGREEVMATDRFSFTFDAGRVTGDTAATLRFKAVCPTEVKTKDIAITIREDIAEPVFTLKAPRTWDGRKAIVWTNTLAGQFFLDGEKDKVSSGSVTGNVLLVKLKAPSVAKQITYLKEISWNQDTLLLGANGLAALTFCEVPILPSRRRTTSARTKGIQ